MKAKKVDPAGVVYLLHFDRRIGSDSARGGARHYVGSTLDLGERLDAHRSGLGAKITAYASAIGVGLVVARTWPGGRALERRIKAQKMAPRLCPICKGEA